MVGGEGGQHPFAYGLRVVSEEIEVRTGSAEAVRDITADCAGFLARQHAGEGLLHIWVPHATAGLAVIETGTGSETDLLGLLQELIPGDHRWSHQHGTPGHGRDHVLPALLPPYASIPVLGGRMTLGTWQSVCLVDTNVDNPMRRVRLSYLAG